MNVANLQIEGLCINHALARKGVLTQIELDGALRDAKAIVIAARQPEMRFVEPKTPDQQARAIVFRARERIVHQRTELVNALRHAL